eukprot:c23843_g1_i1 orf=345-1682(+)
MGRMNSLLLKTCSTTGVGFGVFSLCCNCSNALRSGARSHFSLEKLRHETFVVFFGLPVKLAIRWRAFRFLSNVTPNNGERICAWSSDAVGQPKHHSPHSQRRSWQQSKQLRNVGGTGTFFVTLPTVPNHGSFFNLLHFQSSMAHDSSSEERIGHSEQEGFDKIQGMPDKKTQQNMRPPRIETGADSEIDSADDRPGMGVDVAELGSDTDLDEVDSDFDTESSEEESDVEPQEELEDEEKRKKDREEMWLKLSPEKRCEIGLENAKRILSAALDEDHGEDGLVPIYRQKSLRVGILGAANAGKSSLTNWLVGRKVAAVSRKRNTTLSEILGTLTKGDTQILFYDTPGLVLDILGHPSKTDTRYRSENAWQLRDHCEVLVVILDAYRQIMRPDKRVSRLVERFGKEECPHPKRVLCLNKVDIIKRKSDLLPLATQFGNLPGYERCCN